MNDRINSSPYAVGYTYLGWIKIALIDYISNMTLTFRPCSSQLDMKHVQVLHILKDEWKRHPLFHWVFLYLLFYKNNYMYNFTKKIKIIIIIYTTSFWTVRFLLFFKVSSAHQARIYLIQNTAKTVMWNIFTI